MALAPASFAGLSVPLCAALLSLLLSVQADPMQNSENFAFQSRGEFEAFAYEQLSETGRKEGLSEDQIWAKIKITADKMWGNYKYAQKPTQGTKYVPPAKLTSEEQREHRAVGPSKFYEELEIDTFRKKVLRDDVDVVVAFYADDCVPCASVHSEQEKVAEKISKKTKSIHFARIDQWEEASPPERLYKLIPAAYDFATGVRLGLPKSDSFLPRMYLVKAGVEEALPIPQELIGWKDGDSKKLYKWIKNHTSFPDALSASATRKKHVSDEL